MLSIICSTSVIFRFGPHRLFRRQPGDNNYLPRYPGMSNDKVKKLEKRKLCIRDVLKMNDNELKSLGLTGRALTEIRATPTYTAENITVAFKINKTTGKNQGTATFDLVVSRSSTIRKENRKPSKDGYGFVVALGTLQNGFLLSHNNVMLSLNGKVKSAASRSVVLQFDWTLANSCAGANGGHIVLRVLSSDFRGVDIEYFVPLK